MRFLRSPARNGFSALVLSLFLTIAGCGGGGGGGGATAGTDPQSPPATWKRTVLREVAAGGLTPVRVMAAAGGDGRVHVAFFEDADPGPGPYRITYLTWDPTASDVSEGGTVVELDNADGLAVAATADGRPVVVYQGGVERTCGDERQSDAMVSIREVDGWAEYTAAIGENPRNPVFFDGVAGAGIAAATGPDGVLHVVYQFYYEGCDAMNFAYPDLRHVRIDPNDPSSLSEEEMVEGNGYGENVVQNRVGDHAALTVDADGVLTVFHYAELSDGTQGLRAARRVNATWVSTWVETGCEVGAITVGPPGGEPSVAYRVIRYTDGRDDLGTVRYARWDGAGGWSSETVDDAVRCAGSCSLAFGPDGLPAIAYYEGHTYAGRKLENLKLARFDGVSWKREVVSSSGDVGRYNGVWPDGEGGFAVLGYSDTDRAIYLFRAE